jgi:hypothetical protein
VSDRLWDDPTIPPPGRRSGAGSWSILPYLVKSLAAKPKDGPSPRGDDAPRAAPEKRNDEAQRR